MKASRIYGCVAAISLSALLGACGTEYGAGPRATDSAPVSVPTEASTTAHHGCSLDCGTADEYVPGVGLVRCDWPIDSGELVPDAALASTSLVSACDFRLTGEACEEDELCAVAVVRDTGNFPGPGER